MGNRRRRCGNKDVYEEEAWRRRSLQKCLIGGSSGPRITLGPGTHWWSREERWEGREEDHCIEASDSAVSPVSVAKERPLHTEKCEVEVPVEKVARAGMRVCGGGGGGDRKGERGRDQDPTKRSRGRKRQEEDKGDEYSPSQKIVPPPKNSSN